MCDCQNRNNMARRKRRSSVGAIKKGDVGAILQNGALIFGGVAAASLLNKNIAFLNTNPILSGAAQIGLGVLTPQIVGGNVGASLGVGMAVNGFRTVIAGGAPSVAQTIGISGLTYSNPPGVLPQVSGSGYYGGDVVTID